MKIGVFSNENRKNTKILSKFSGRVQSIFGGCLYFYNVIFSCKVGSAKALTVARCTSPLLLTYSYNARFKDKKENAFKLFFLSFFFPKMWPEKFSSKRFLYLLLYILRGHAVHLWILNEPDHRDRRHHHGLWIARPVFTANAVLFNF